VDAAGSERGNARPCLSESSSEIGSYGVVEAVSLVWQVGEGERTPVVVVPALGRELARDDGGAHAVAILEHLEEIAAVAVGDGRDGEVVEHEDVDAREAGEETGIAAVGAGEAELVEEARGPPVCGAEALAAGLLGERATAIKAP
jgi:hypothetical protein